jgi:hypothetical protein
MSYGWTDDDFERAIEADEAQRTSGFAKVFGSADPPPPGGYGFPAFAARRAPLVGATRPRSPFRPPAFLGAAEIVKASAPTPPPPEPSPFEKAIKWGREHPWIVGGAAFGLAALGAFYLSRRGA